MPYPKTCPSCGIDLTRYGHVVEGQAIEVGYWEARIDSRGFIDYETFVTEQTIESGTIQCVCGHPLNEEG